MIGERDQTRHRIRHRVHHVSTLAYAAPVSRARFNLRLQPRLRAGQALEMQNLSFSPHPALHAQTSGPYWVNTARVGFEAPLSKLEVTSEFVITAAPVAVPASGPSIKDVRAGALEAADLGVLAPAPYLFASRIAGIEDAITRWAAPYLAPGGDVIEAISALMGALHGEFTYDPRATDSRTPPHEAFAARRGVCQDLAHVMIMAARAHSIPAAYVSGYLLTQPPPGKPKLVGADAMHAWVDIWCGSALGWVGFDPTNNCLAGDDHIAIGMGRDYADVSPIDGTFIGSAPQSMASKVDVERIG